MSSSALTDYQTRVLEQLNSNLRSLAVQLARFNDTRSSPAWSVLSMLIERHEYLDDVREMFGITSGDVALDAHDLQGAVDRLDEQVMREVVKALGNLDGGQPIEGYIAQSA